MKSKKPFHAIRTPLGLAGLFAYVLLLGLGNLAGCGGKKSDEGEKSETKSTQANNTNTPKTGTGNPVQPPVKSQAGSNAGRRRGVYTVNGQKFYNKHPYDIWYKNAYEVAGNNTPVGSGVPKNGGGTKVAKNNPNAGMKKKDPPPKTGGGGDWKALADIADLEAEVKAIRNFLTQKMRTPASYRQDYKKIQQAGATLAALGQVISQHPSDINLKKNALYVRDLGLAISEAASGRGVKEFRAAKVPYEQLIDTLNGSKPAGLKEPKKDAEFFDFADRGGLMYRMDDAHKWLSKEINTADKMKADAERVKREASMIAVLMKVIGDKSYDSAEDTDYKGHVAESIKQADYIKAALKTGDFAKYEKAVSTIYNRCNQCHTKYRQ